MARADGVQRLLAYAIGLGAPAAVLSPLIWEAPDSFPISTYPMFAQARGQPTLYSAIAVSSSGQQARLPPPMLGTKEVLQAKVLIQRSVEGGPETLAQLCEATAARVASAPEFARSSAIAIVQRRYDPIAYFVSGPTPLAEQRLFECALPARGSAKVEAQ